MIKLDIAPSNSWAGPRRLVAMMFRSKKRSETHECLEVDAEVGYDEFAMLQIGPLVRNYPRT